MRKVLDPAKKGTITKAQSRRAVKAVMKKIEEERERCAKIAESYKVEKYSLGMACADQVRTVIADNIAWDIRNKGDK